MRFILLLLALLSSATPALAERDLSVLLVGNSYTLRNDMGQMLEQVAASGQGPKITAQVAAKNGATLAELWRDADIRGAVNAAHHDFVVLQEQSLWAMFPEKVEETAKSAQAWNTAIMKADGKPVIFETWERQPNSFWYTDKRYGFLKTPKNMREKFAAASTALAAQIGAKLAPVGEVYGDVLKDNAKWPLYENDSSHPSVAGSYLAALVLYKTLTGHSPTETTFVPQGLNADSAARLRAYAAGR